VITIREEYIKCIKQNNKRLTDIVIGFLRNYNLKNDNENDYINTIDITTDSIKISLNNHSMKELDVIGALVHRGDCGIKRPIINTKTNKKDGEITEYQTVPVNFYLFFIPFDKNKLICIVSKYKQWGLKEITEKELDKFIKKITKNCVNNSNYKYSLSCIRVSSITNIVEQINELNGIIINKITKKGDISERIMNNMQSKPKYSIKNEETLKINVGDKSEIMEIIKTLRDKISYRSKKKNKNNTNSDNTTNSEINFIKIETKLKSGQEKMIRFDDEGIHFLEDYIVEINNSEDIEHVMTCLKNDDKLLQVLKEILSSNDKN